MPDEVIVVFDSNVLIPAIIPASLSARLFSRLEAAGWIVAASPQLLAEVRDKLAAKPSLRQWLGLTDGMPQMDISRGTLVLGGASRYRSKPLLFWPRVGHRWPACLSVMLSQPVPFGGGENARFWAVKKNAKPCKDKGSRSGASPTVGLTGDS